MGGIKLLATHDEMAGKVTPCKEKEIRSKQVKCLLLLQEQKKLRFKAPPQKKETNKSFLDVYRPIKCLADIIKCQTM